MDRLVYRVADAAKALGLSRSRVYELIQEGELEVGKIGGCTVITAASIEALVDRAVRTRRVR